MTDQQEKAMRMALEALDWYVKEDDVIESMAGNEPWVEGKRNAEKAIQTLRQALAQEQRLRIDNSGDIRSEPYPKAYKNKEEFEEAQKRLMKELKQSEQEPVDWEAVATDQAMTIAMMKIEKREWVGLVKGARVEGDKVIIATKDNDVARELCGKLIEEKNT